MPEVIHNAASTEDLQTKLENEVINSKPGITGRFFIELIIFGGIVHLCLGCGSANADRSLVKQEFPVELYVSNQTGAVDPVNIKISIDDHKEIVNQSFSCGTGHNVSTFKLSLKEGVHQLLVTSDNGDAGLDVVFMLDKPVWLSIDYWGKNHFQLNISDRPVVFM